MMKMEFEVYFSQRKKYAGTVLTDQYLRLTKHFRMCRQGKFCNTIKFFDAGYLRNIELNFIGVIIIKVLSMLT